MMKIAIAIIMSSHHHEAGEKKSFKNVFTYPFGPFLDDISLSFVVGIVLAAVLSTFLPYDSLSQYGITNGLPAILADAGDQLTDLYLLHLFDPSGFDPAGQRHQPGSSVCLSLCRAGYQCCIYRLDRQAAG